jgi:hypothetical protein
MHGPLRVSPTNPRYFTDDSGRAVYLTGSHTWATLVEIQCPGDPDFPYDEWLDFMVAHNHNFMRLWTWDHPSVAPWTDDPVTFAPMAHLRTGPGLAADGLPRWNLEQFNPEYFERLRRRVVQAGERGIYCAVMFFEAWCTKWSRPGADAWLSHPYRAGNNVNGVDGDPDGDGVADIYTLRAPDVVRYQKRYMQHVIDTVNDLDNVLFEIINEIPVGEDFLRWHYHMIDFVHEYERTQPKQHPVGMTAEGGGEDNRLLFASNADWISPGYGEQEEYKYNPPPGDGRKIILADTDHMWGHGGTYQWAWKSFLRGLNPLFMDPWMPIPGRTRAGYSGNDLNNTRDYPDWAPLRIALGQTRRLAERVDLLAMTPHPELASSGYCLAEPGHAYIAYFPDDARGWLDLTGAPGRYAVEWLNTRTGQTATDADLLQGGARQRMHSPLGMDCVALITAI